MIALKLIKVKEQKVTFYVTFWFNSQMVRRAARGTFSFFFESLTAVCKMKWTFSSMADRLWLIV